MADAYLAISQIAADEAMNNRVRACVTQQDHLGAIDINSAAPAFWAADNAYLWASSPTWGEKWDYALSTGNDNPGADAAVITDGDILATIQALAPLPPPPEEPAT
jgi:hypothetical protein